MYWLWGSVLQDGPMSHGMGEAERAKNLENANKNGPETHISGP